MTSSEIRRTLESSIHRTVEVKWTDAGNERVKVISVDDEGFVYDLVPPDPKTPFWTSFDGIVEITPSKLF